jgi:hypothetical protein
MSEARSILRDAVEFVAHGHWMLTDPELQKTWLSKNDDEAALKAFKDAFEHSKKDRVFKGLDELHKTGSGRGELSGLKWEDINFEKKVLTPSRSIVAQHVGSVKT